MAQIKVAEKNKVACTEYRKPIERKRENTERKREKEYRRDRYERCNQL